MLNQKRVRSRPRGAITDMKSLNQKSTILFLQLIDQLPEKDHELILYRPGNDPLRIEKIRKIRSEEGMGILYSIGTLEQELNLTYSLLMEFVVVDKRDKESKAGPVLIYPILYRDDLNETEEPSVFIRFGQMQVCNPILYMQHVFYGEVWLHNLQKDGFIQ